MASSTRPLSGPDLSLPVEVLEMVLAQLPHAFLITTCTTVCKLWRDVIMNPVFLPWKKLYHCYKMAPETKCSSTLVALLLSRDDDNSGVGDITACEVMKHLDHRHGFTDITTCLVAVIRAIGEIHKAPQGSTGSLLESHPLYTMALNTYATISQSTSLPQLPLPSTPSVWHLAATIVVLSPDVWQIRSLITLMLYPGSSFTPCKVVEGFYSLALFLLYSNQCPEILLPTRYHYQLFYALYLYENEWTVTPPVQQAMRVQGGVNTGPARAGGEGRLNQQSLDQFVLRTPSLRHTHEQLRIISHNLQPNHVVKIVAFAGTGKTTTLLHLCKSRPAQRFLLVVYNKSVQEHCARTFPRNTTVKTAHAMAFAAVGRRYAAIGRFVSNLSGSSIADFLHPRKGSGNRFHRAGLVKNTLQRFLNSADEHLSLQHVPEKDKHQEALDDNFRLTVVLADAEAVWAEMIQCTRTQTLPMTQEGQLKLWQLSQPVIPGYDVLMVDEGQDMNPTMLDVFLKQPYAKVIVGDPYQQIYAFRGAINALESVHSTHTFFLTQSFRFGPQVAFIAHCILDSVVEAHGRTLVGGNKVDAISTTPVTHGKTYREGRLLRMAYLGRSNYEVYTQALLICENDKNSGHRMAFAGGIDKYGFDTVLDIYYLDMKEKSKIKNRLVARSQTVTELQIFAQKIDDVELNTKVMMYRHSHMNTPRHIRLLKEMCSAPQDTADITFSTIHKAKGLEWDHVVLLSDANFLEDYGIDENEHSSKLLPRDEVNLLYVSVTRAKCLLTLNSPLLDVLRMAHDCMEVLVDSSEVAQSECVQCCEVLQKETKLTTKVSPLMMSDGNLLAGGYLCLKCSTSKSRDHDFNESVLNTVAFALRPRKRDNEYSRWARAVLLTGQPVHL